MLKTLLQLQCANLELSFSSTPPFPSCSGSSLWAGDECLHCSGSVCSMGQARSVRHLQQCLLCWAAQPPSPVLAELCSTVRTWLLSQVSSRRAKTRCIYTSGWCLAISLTRGRKAVVALCDKINLPCQVDLPHFHSKHHCLLPEQFLDARTSPSVLVSSLSEHSNSHRTSRPDICKTGSFGIKLQTQQLRKVIFQLSHPLLTSYSGCCYVLCPSKNQIASWAVASMRVSGDLSHLSVKVLLSRHRWKAWSFAFFLQQEHFSHHFSTCHSRTKLWPIPSYLPFWGTEGFFKDPFWISFQKCSIQQQFLDLPLLTWKKEHSNSHFSEPWVQSD